MSDDDELRARIRALRERFAEFNGESESEFLIDEVANLQLKLEHVVRRVDAVEFALSARDLLMPIAPATAAAEWPKHARIEPDMFLPSESGFHYLEHDAQGRPYRWTGPAKEFGFELFLDRRSPLPFSIGLSGAEARTLGLMAFVDGHPVVLKRQKQKSSVVVSGVLPASPTFAPTWLQFQVPEVVRPKDQDPANQDERLLGVAFHFLEVGTKGH